MIIPNYMLMTISYQTHVTQKSQKFIISGKVWLQVMYAFMCKADLGGVSSIPRSIKSSSFLTYSDNDTICHTRHENVININIA